IKNEVMRLDDIEAADAPRVETYLAKVKVLRRIAQYLIEFLSQLEDFQKRLWLKKKFVVDTHFCITLDRVPDEFYAEIAANETQREEWVRLFSINDFAGYTEPLSADFLSENRALPLDTRFFEVAFVENILAQADINDENTSGVLILNLYLIRVLREEQCVVVRRRKIAIYASATRICLDNYVSDEGLRSPSRIEDLLHIIDFSIINCEHESPILRQYVVEAIEVVGDHR
ncbi:MAG: hypothetical protein RLN96_11020, partial [Pseudomonadales bacterium]